MPSQYVYSSLITTDTSNPYIYKDENNVIYTALNVTVDNETFIDLFMSINDGDDWYKDAVPIKNFNLYNPKFFIKNDVYYIFAYGKEYDKDAIYYIRKFTNIQDKQGNNIDDIWETDWNKVVFDSRYHCRITDITTDEIGYFVFIAYDKETDNGVYESRLAVFSLTEFSIKMDVSVNKNNLINQHNGKLTIMDDSIISVAWEMQMEDVYASKTYQIAYRQYDIVSKEWSNVVIVSNDKLNNNYHQSMTIDSDNNIFITWLNTKPDTIEYYKTNKIYLATIVNCEVSNIEEISQLAKNNEYPIVTVDEYDSLYIVYTTNDYIQYLTRKINSTEWIEITNLRQSNYQSMTAFCYNQNLYTIANKDDTAYLVRIDVDLAENFQPVDDFQIIDIDNKEISFIWTSARNAEDIKLQILLEEKDWNWVKPNTTAEVNPSTNNVNVVNLTPNRLYAFKLVYKTNDNKLHTLFFPKRLITENDIIHNYNFSWNIPANTVEQKLYIAQELWKDIADIKNDADEYTLKYDSQATAFRLNITGGKASGYSNITSPLTIDLLNDDYLLQWIPFANVSKIELEQSIDGLHFFKANILPLKKTECKCIIKNTNKVTYWYRLKYISNNKVKYSNVVTLTNNLRVTHIGYNSVDIQWTTNTEEEIIKFQYTIDDGTTWKTVVNSIKNSQSIIRKLKHFTDYKLRLYYPNRFTGKYSNVISFKTLKCQVENFRLNTHPNVNILGFENDKKKYLKINNNHKTITDEYTDIPIVNNIPRFKFVIGNVYQDIKIHYTDVTANAHKEILLSNITDKQIEQYTATKKEISFTLTLEKGILYSIYIEVLNSDYGNSQPILIQTNGDTKPNLSVESSIAHSFNVKYDTLDKITNVNVSNNVNLYYSNYDNDDLTNYISINNINQPYVLQNLIQDTQYRIQLEICYGKHFGRTEVIKARTKQDKFSPIFGDRNYKERTFAFSKKENKFYIFDRGKLYKYTNYNNQELVVDYNIQANNIYADMLSDKNGYIHLIFTYGKFVYYCTNVVDEHNKQCKLTDKILIENNEYVNEYLYPNLAIEYNKNLLYMVWQEDFGTFSTVSLMQYRNGKPTFDESLTMLNNDLQNNFPKIRLTRENGFKIFAIDSIGRLQLVSADIDNDYESDTYLDLKLDTDVLELPNAIIEEYNDYDVTLDNLDNVRIMYDSTVGDKKTSTYVTYIENKVTVESTFFNNLTSTHIYAYDELVLIGKDNEKIYTSKYIAREKEFSDLNQETYTIEKNPLTVYADKDNIYTLSTKNGMFIIYQTKVEDIIAKNNYVDGKWIDNKFALQNETLRVFVECWSNGDTNNYPQLYLKVNNKVKEITPVDQNGIYNIQNLKVKSLVELGLNDPKVVGIKTNETLMIIQLLYNNDREIIIDITDMLCYTWDNKEIINKFSH